MPRRKSKKQTELEIATTEMLTKEAVRLWQNASKEVDGSQNLTTPKPVTQSRRHSLLEALLNTLSGFVISFFVADFTFAFFNFHSTHQDTFIITCVFTVVSIVRSYIWRRVFNALHSKGVL